MRKFRSIKRRKMLREYSSLKDTLFPKINNQESNSLQGVVQSELEGGNSTS